MAHDSLQLRRRPRSALALRLCAPVAVAAVCAPVAVAAGFLVAAVEAAPASAAPRVTLVPARPVPGSVLAVWLTGFPPRSRAGFSLDGRVRHFRVGRRGRAGATFTLPATAR